MPLDVETLVTMASWVTGLLGVFLLLIWVQERGIRALAWWGAAYLMGGSAVALWGTQGDLPWINSTIPNLLLFTACGMIWCGARLFQGRRILVSGLFGGAIVWLVAVDLLDIAQSDAVRIVVSSVVIAAYAFLTAYELRRERRRSLARMIMAFGTPLLHATVFLSPIPMILIAASNSTARSWFALLALETLLYVVGTAFIVIVMAKERIVLVHKTAALTDPLTGLPNRRAVLEAAERLMALQTRKKGMVTALLFDLDRFKSINDRFGHAAGDEILKTFARTISANMRAEDVYGRLGGEEFAAILQGGPEEAAVVAERLRAAYQAAGMVAAGVVMNSTVSIGIATAKAPVMIEDLFAAADVALYRAKEKGRNRIEITRELIQSCRPPAASALPGRQPILSST